MMKCLIFAGLAVNVGMGSISFGLCGFGAWLCTHSRFEAGNCSAQNVLLMGL